MAKSRDLVNDAEALFTSVVFERRNKPEATPPCPKGGQLLRQARNELTDQESKEVLAHASKCPACQFKVEALTRGYKRSQSNPQLEAKPGSMLAAWGTEFDELQTKDGTASNDPSGNRKAWEDVDLTSCRSEAEIDAKAERWWFAHWANESNANDSPAMVELKRLFLRKGVEAKEQLWAVFVGAKLNDKAEFLVALTQMVTQFDTEVRQIKETWQQRKLAESTVRR